MLSREPQPARSPVVQAAVEAANKQNTVYAQREARQRDLVMQSLIRKGEPKK